jgi:hypothetical protein
MQKRIACCVALRESKAGSARYGPGRRANTFEAGVPRPPDHQTLAWAGRRRVWQGGGMTGAGV